MPHCRFYAPELALDRRRVALPAEEGEHLARVLRLRVGDRVAAFDGLGHEFLAEVASIDRQAVWIEALEAAPATPEPCVRLALAQAVLRGDKVDEVVRDAVMLGVAAFVPVVSARTEIPPATLARGQRVARWIRVAVASAKQSGRAVVPHVGHPCPLPEYVGAEEAAARIILVEPHCPLAVGGGLAALAARGIPASAALLVGPEGGWTDQEVEEAAGRGFVTVTLGPRTLRAERAAAAAIAVLQYVWGDFHR